MYIILDNNGPILINDVARHEIICPFISSMLLVFSVKYY